MSMSNTIIMNYGLDKEQSCNVAVIRSGRTEGYIPDYSRYLLDSLGDGHCQLAVKSRGDYEVLKQQGLDSIESAKHPMIMKTLQICFEGTLLESRSVKDISGEIKKMESSPSSTERISDVFYDGDTDSVKVEFESDSGTSESGSDSGSDSDDSI